MGRRRLSLDELANQRAAKPIWRSSVLDRRFSCHGSATLEPLVDEYDSGEGDEGTWLHWAIADRLIREHGAVPPAGGLPPPKVPPGYKAPANCLWMVDWCVRHVIESVPPTWALMVEVELSYEFDKWINIGHLDWLALSPDGRRAKGGDYKTGRDPVDPADNNWQTFSYTCLAKLNWGTLEMVEFDLMQPRLTEEDEFERISTLRIEADRLDGAPGSLNLFAEMALDDPMTLTSGKKQCRYCPVGLRLQCAALKEDLRMSKITLTPEAIAAVKRTPSDAQLGDWVCVARTLAPVSKAAEEELHNRLDATECVVAGNGTAITRKVQRGNIEVVAPLELYQKAKELLVTDERMAVAFKPSKTRIIDELAAAQNIPKGGLEPVTAEGIWNAHLAVHVKQGVKRILQFSQ